MLAATPQFLIEIIFIIVAGLVIALYSMIRSRFKSADRDDLYSACMFGDLEKARDFFSKNQKIDLNDNEENFNDHSLLSAAVYGGNPEIVGLLVSKGADVNVDFGFSGTPLNAAVESESLLMAELLLKLGADPNKEPDLQLRPLFLASEAGHAELIRLLVDYGADVDIRDEDGDTVVHLAAHAGQAAIVHLLVELGARGDLKNNEGLSAYDILRENRERIDHEAEMG